VEDGRTGLSLDFSAFGSLFVVFRPGKAEPVASWTRVGSASTPGGRVWRTDDAIVIESSQAGLYEITGSSGARAQAEIRNVPPPLPFSGLWTVQFPSGWGAPPETTMELNSWTAHPDAGVRYFSGTATYLREFDLPEELLAQDIVPVLDLGAVKNLAKVVVNGSTAAILWRPPFRAPLAGRLKPGLNRLEIKVTNLWVNRLVGDELHPDDCEWNPLHFNCNDLTGQSIRRIPDWVWTGGPRPQASRRTFTTWKFYSWSTPLPPAGLMGPVTLLADRLQTIAAPPQPGL
jgi:hypothetical protein